MDVKIEKIKKLSGEITIPSDKSISHRAVIISGLTGGSLNINNFSLGADCHSSLNIMKNLGCEIEFKDAQKLLFKAPKKLMIHNNVDLDCGNSGTSMRLLSGVLAAQEFDSVLVGDSSLSKRPMKRVIEPLELMGAKIDHNNFKAPLKICGSVSELQGITYHSKLASAQVKSAILLAGLNANGSTVFSEPYKSRNHTENMLTYFGADLKIDKNIVKISRSELIPKDIDICGDISSAAFFLVAACIIPNSSIIIKNVGVNETRGGILEILEKMGANIEYLDRYEESNESVCDIKISYSDLKAITIEGEIIPRLIDEIPVICVLATQANGTTYIKDAQDLRNKEADRIKSMVVELKKIGADIQETQDGFIINGKTRLKGDAIINCYGDHRIAMSLYIAGLICNKPIQIRDFHWVDISFPEFLNLIDKLKN